MISDDSSVSISKHPTVTFNILGLPVLCLSKLYATCFFVKLTMLCCSIGMSSICANNENYYYLASMSISILVATAFVHNTENNRA